MESDTIGINSRRKFPWGHGDLNAGHRTPSPVGYQATLWPRTAELRMQKWHIRISQSGNNAFAFQDLSTKG